MQAQARACILMAILLQESAGGRCERRLDVLGRGMPRPNRTIYKRHDDGQSTMLRIVSFARTVGAG